MSGEGVEEEGGGARSQWRAEIPWQEGTDKVPVQ